MGTTFCTWTSDCPGPLRGAGVDAERIDRFRREPLEGVFGPGERLRASRGDGRDAERLCAGFCVKEALWKALEEPYDLRECEVIADPEADRAEVLLHGDLAVRLRGTVLEVRIWRDPEEIRAAVLVHDGAALGEGETG